MPKLAPMMLLVMLVCAWILYIAFSPSYDDRVHPHPSTSISRQ